MLNTLILNAVVKRMAEASRAIANGEASDSPNASPMGLQTTGLNYKSSGDPLYDRMYQSNPYVGLTYNKSWWQNLIEGLGFRTDYDRWLEDAQVNAGEYDARIAEFMAQNEYNDPTAQAQRERAAGLNPDLLGIGDVAEAASSAPDPNGMSSNAGANELTQFGESLMGVLGKTVALYRDFKGISELDNIIEAGDFENAKNFYSSIDAFLQNRFMEGDFKNRSSYNSAVARIKGELEDELTLGRYRGSSASRVGIRMKDWKRWTESAGERLDSLMGDDNAFSTFAKAGKARSSATASILDPMYTKTDEQDEVIFGVAQIVGDNFPQVVEAKSKNDKYQENLRTGALENQGIEQDIKGQELDYLLENEAGVKSAQAQLAKYDADWYSSQIHAVTDNMQKQILDFLKEKAKTSRFASLMLMNWTLNNMVNMGINASANASVGLNLGLGANIANTVSTIFKP